MFTRPYGKTGIELSAVGFGGIICMNESPANAARHVSKAIERGVNYFDVAPSYGNAQDILGPALQPYRKEVFLACKTGERGAKGAARELNESLTALRTDYFDLYQLHGMNTIEEVEKVLGADGAMETLEQARRDGIVRHIGFSAHTEEAATALMERFDFTSVLFPINWVAWNTGKFGPKVVAVAQETDTCVLALKALAKRKLRDGEESGWPKCWYSPVETYEEAQLAFRFALSRPVTAAVSPGHAEFLWWACDAADGFRALSEA